MSIWSSWLRIENEMMMAFTPMLQNEEREGRNKGGKMGKDKEALMTEVR